MSQIPTGNSAEVTIAWAAGFFDGEGCIQIRKSSTGSKGQPVAYSLLVSVDNTDPRPLQIFHKWFGGVFKKKIAHNGKYVNKTVWRWAVTTQIAEDTLRVLVPYLINKKDEAMLALYYRDTFVGPKGAKTKPDTTKIELLRTMMTELKHREWSKFNPQTFSWEIDK